MLVYLKDGVGFAVTGNMSVLLVEGAGNEVAVDFLNSDFVMLQVE
jgi:hypothetical protein